MSSRRVLPEFDKGGELKGIKKDKSETEEGRKEGERRRRRNCGKTCFLLDG